MTDLHEFDKNRTLAELVELRQMDRLRIQELEVKIGRYEKALRSIAVYDLYDCSDVEDTDFHDQAKLMYEIADDALRR